jgi:hypothetical protein
MLGGPILTSPREFVRGAASTASVVAPLPSDFASSGLVGSALLHRLRAMSTGRGASRNGSPPRETRSSKVGDEMRCSKARDAMDNCFCRRVQVWSEFIRERVLKRVASRPFATREMRDRWRFGRFGDVFGWVFMSRRVLVRRIHCPCLSRPLLPVDVLLRIAAVLSSCSKLFL